MEIETIINKLKDYYGNLILEQRELINVDLIDISKFDLKSYDYLVENPDEIERIYNIAFEEKYKDSNIEMPNIKIMNVLESEERQINRLRHKDFNELISIKGIIVSRTKVFPRIKSIKYECPSCGNILNILQTTDDLVEPNRCGCGRKGKFKTINKEFEDCLILQIEELPEKLKPSETPYNIYCKITGNLVNKDYYLYLGCRLELFGYLQERIKILNRKKSNNCDFLFNILGYKNLDYVDFSTDINEDEKKLFEELKNSPNPAKMISKFLFSDIYGYKIVKEVCILQQFGGEMYCGKRDYIHILLFGDPGTGKSDIALRCAKINPISKIASGTHTSGVGLTASVEKDELSGRWVAKGGLLCRCNSGLAVIDEIEKMNDNDKKSLHMPMESGFFGLEKAGISAKLVTKTAILATSNPKVVGNNQKVVIENCDLPVAIIDRFDFIFKFHDRPETTKDEIIASFITDRATFSHNDTTFSENNTTFSHNDTTYYIDTIKKYIYLSKKTQPKLSRRVNKILYKWYSNIRSASETISWEAKKPSPRTLETILRISRAICRSKFKDKITIIELKLAIKYFNFMTEYDSNIFNVEIQDVS